MHPVSVRSIVLLAALLIAGGCTGLERRVIPELHEIPDLQQSFDYQPATLHSAPLIVLTLNVAHGRRNGIHQLLQGAGKHRRNLDDISTVLRREEPHVVALQEADGPSLWSGGFSHVAYLAHYGGFGYHILGAHDHVPGLSHGTALLSRLRLRNPLAVTFRNATPVMPKGFIISTVAWPARPAVEIDIISVHLDVFNARLRERQIEELMEVVATRARPFVLMGDLNTVWNGRRKLLQEMTEQFGLTTFEPESATHATFSLLGRRYDWVFVSRGLTIQSYETLPDVLSDHRAVKASILLRSGGSPAARQTGSKNN